MLVAALFYDPFSAVFTHLKSDWSALSDGVWVLAVAQDPAYCINAQGYCVPLWLGLSPLLKIEQNQWLQDNRLYLQFGLFFLGITARILVINSVRPIAGIFFMLTLMTAAGVVALYVEH